MFSQRQASPTGALCSSHKTDIECMGILWGYGSVEELTQAGADYIARTPQEAADMLLS